MAVLSVKELPEELMVLLKVRAAQERSTLRSIVIGELSKVTGVPNITETLKQCKFINTNPMLYPSDTHETVTNTVIVGPLERALLQIWPILIDFDKSMIVARLRKGRQRVKATKGRCEGNKPFGHYDGEMAILGVILALRTAHVSSRANSTSKAVLLVPASLGAAPSSPKFYDAKNNHKCNQQPTFADIFYKDLSMHRSMHCIPYCQPSHRDANAIGDNSPNFRRELQAHLEKT